jgi:hypothetical protein
MNLWYVCMYLCMLAHKQVATNRTTRWQQALAVVSLCVLAYELAVDDGKLVAVSNSNRSW